MSNMLKIKEIETQYGTTQKIVLYCNKIEEKETKSKDSKKYLLFHLTDGETDIDAKRWNYSMEDFKNASVPVEIPGVVIMKLEVQEYNGQPSFIVQGFTTSDRCSQRRHPLMRNRLSKQFCLMHVNIGNHMHL